MNNAYCRSRQGCPSREREREREREDGVFNDRQYSDHEYDEIASLHRSMVKDYNELAVD